MSYILDALKKSEMQARQGESPSIHSSHAGPVQSHRPGWLYALSGGAAAAVLFAAAYLLLPHAGDVPAPTVAQLLSPAVSAPAQANRPAEPQSSAPLTPINPQTVPVMQVPSTQAIPETHPATTPATLPASEPLQTAAAQPVNSQPVAAETTSAQPASTQPVRAQQTSESVTPSPAPEAIPLPDIQIQAAAPSIPLLSQLPVAVQESLPPIDVSGHIYDARPAARMVFINGNIHREGDMIAANLQLLGITPNGVELSFRNTSFRIELFAMPEPNVN